MRNIDRRKWLKTVGLSSSLALLTGLERTAYGFTGRPLPNDGPIRLNANENPYGPSDRVRKVLSQTFDEACRYPFRAFPSLVAAIAEKEGVPKDHIVVTGGSTEGLNAAGLLYGSKGEIISADPTFHVLMQYAANLGAHIHRVALNERMEHDLEVMASKVNPSTALIYICNPNNPTGTLIEKNRLRDFCNSFEKNAVIFSDEAYYDFIMEADYPSMTALVKEGKNVIVAKTFSKIYGLAGLRIGYLITLPHLASKLKSSIMANTNILAIAAALEALRDDDFYKFSLLKTQQAKQYIYDTLEELGLPYLPSHTNFVFFKTGRPINTVRAAMLEANIQIGRPFPPFLDWARISTGTLEEMEILGHALRKSFRG